VWGGIRYISDTLLTALAVVKCSVLRCSTSFLSFTLGPREHGCGWSQGRFTSLDVVATLAIVLPSVATMVDFGNATGMTSAVATGVVNWGHATYPTMGIGARRSPWRPG
jgi:hypothetical protein